MSEKDYNLTDPANELSVDDEAFQGFEDSDSLLWNTEFESLSILRCTQSPGKSQP